MENGKCTHVQHAVFDSWQRCRCTHRLLNVVAFFWLIENVVASGQAQIRAQVNILLSQTVAQARQEAQSWRAADQHTLHNLPRRQPYCKDRCFGSLVRLSDPCKGPGSLNRQTTMQAQLLGSCGARLDSRRTRRAKGIAATTFAEKVVLAC